MDNIRTVIDAKPRNYHYTVVEYLTNGGFKTYEVKSADTSMRIEQDGQQFEVDGAGWRLIPPNDFAERFEEWLMVRKEKGYDNNYPKPIFLNAEVQ